MKKLLVILLTGFVFLNSCAKPTVVDSIMPGDEELNCGQLKNSVAEAQRFIKDAESVKGGTGDNWARGLFFWPAIIQSYSNANEAIAAANTRKVHLFNIMRKKNCNNVGSLVVETTAFGGEDSKRSEESLSNELQNLSELYKSGVLSEEEFKQAKKKILN